MKHEVLIIDHDLTTCKKIKYNLASTSITVRYMRSVSASLSELAKNRFDAVILELSFPGIDGMELLRRLRQLDNMPILVTSATPSRQEKIRAIADGADTYLSKPLDVEDCIIETHALLRRYTELNPIEKRNYALVTCGELLLDRNHRVVLLENYVLPFSRRDYDLFEVLACNSQQVLTFRLIHESLWDEEYVDDAGSRNRVRCQIKRLRKKLPIDFIETVRDVGFRIKKTTSMSNGVDK